MSTNPETPVTTDDLNRMAVALFAITNKPVTLESMVREMAEWCELEGRKGADVSRTDPDEWHKLIVQYWRECPRDLLDCLVDFEGGMIEAYAAKDMADLGRQVGLRMYEKPKKELVRLIDVEIEEAKIRRYHEGIDAARFEGYDEE